MLYSVMAMEPLRITALVLYLLAAVLQIGALVRAWVKTRRESEQARQSLREMLEVDEEYSRKKESLEESWQERGLPPGHEIREKQQAEANQRYHEEMAAAGHRTVTWFYHDTIADQVWAHILDSGRTTYKREGWALVIGILLGTVASVLTLFPMG